MRSRCLPGSSVFFLYFLSNFAISIESILLIVAIDDEQALDVVRLMRLRGSQKPVLAYALGSHLWECSWMLR